MGSYNAALPLLEQARNIILRLLGEEHPNYAAVLFNLASHYESMGKYEDALPLSKQAKNILQLTHGDMHPDYAKSLNDLGYLYKVMGNYKAALPLYEEAKMINKIAFLISGFSVVLMHGTVELSRRSVARDLPFRKWRDMRERSALVIC